MSLQELLKECGYREHYNPDGQMFHSTEWLYQKRVTDPTGIRYFLNAYYYPDRNISGIDLKEGLQWEVQFNMEDGSCFDVTLNGTDIDKAQRFFHDLWMSVRGVEYYERN